MPATPTPYQDALDNLAKRTAVGSIFRTFQWENTVPQKIREESFFSAGVAKASVLQEMKDRLREGLELSRRDGIGMNRARFTAEMRALLDPFGSGDSGALTDITSYRRLGLIWDFQNESAFEEGRWRTGMAPELLDEFPAQRLVRIEDRVQKRDWWARWGRAGAAVNWQGASRSQMVALRTSPIWTEVSRFGRPYPPFDFGSGMGLDDVDRDEAESLGLIAPGDPPPDGAAAIGDYERRLEASVENLDTQTIAWLRDHLQTELGPVSIDGGKIRGDGP